jgi:acyl-CoA thioester hydrolase
MPKIHRYACPLRWSDMDAYGHVNNTTFLTYLEEARIDLLLGGGGAAGRYMLDTGIVVARHEVDYVAPLTHRPEPIIIDVWATEVRNAAFSVAYRVHDEGSADSGPVTYAKAATTLVAYDLAAGQVRRLSDGERAMLKAYLHQA